MPYKNLQSGRALQMRRLNVQKHQRRIRVRALMLHGGRCQKCDFNDMRALQLDHVNGGGYTDRIIQGNNGYTMSRQALARPADFQVLCANCNWIKKSECGENAGYLATAGGN